MTDRYFQNNYPDYNGETCIVNSNITHWIQHQKDQLEQNIDPSDATVYTGSAGIALLYLRLAIIFSAEKDGYKSKAKTSVDSALEKLKGKQISFLNGDPGPLAIAAVIYNDLGDQKTANKCIDRIVSMKDAALSDLHPDEYLYGRAGYLYTLMYLRREIGNDIINKQLVIDVCEGIIKSGEKYAKETKSKSPLMYKWHEKEYMGAAHGISGIIYLLLKVTQQDSFSNLRTYVDSHLIPTVEFLKSKRLSSGNYLSSSESKSDKLVQWCHGAPGFVYLFVCAHEITNDNSYLELALSAGDVVWERGLLTKGYGLCHGTAGNGYMFFLIYIVEPMIINGYIELLKTPDHPYSLFEGLAGTIYFMTDVLNPTQARFPAFE